MFYYFGQSQSITKTFYFHRNAGNYIQNPFSPPLIGTYLGRDARILFQRHAGHEPKAVGYCETGVAAVVLGVRPPLVRGEPGQEEHGEADGHVSGEHAAPDAGRQGTQESEQFRRFVARYLRDENK